MEVFLNIFFFMLCIFSPIHPLGFLHQPQDQPHSLLILLSISFANEIFDCANSCSEMSEHLDKSEKTQLATSTTDTFTQKH